MATMSTHPFLLLLLLKSALFTDISVAAPDVYSRDVLDLTNIIGIPIQIPIGNQLNDITYYQEVAELQNNLLPFKDPGLSICNFSNIIHRHLSEENIVSDDLCVSDSMKIVNILCKIWEKKDIKALEDPSNYYALQFFDATAKVPHGILQGKWMWTGDYEQCHSIISAADNKTGHTFQGKYFSAFFSGINKTFFDINGFKQNLGVGLCLPNTCNSADVNLYLYILSKELNFTAANISFAGAIDDERPGYDGRAITAFIVSGILGGLVIIGTVADLIFSPTNEQMQTFVKGTGNATVYDEPTERTGLLAGEIFTDSGQIQVRKWSSMKNKVLDILKCFSFLNNSQKLINTSTAKGQLACLNGLRVISMWWVIQGHTYAFIITVIDNALEAGNVIQRFSFQPIINGTFSVDTFFFLSGVLVAYLALKELNENGKLSWAYFFLHRYWRLTPLYGVVLMIYSTLSTYMFTGPFGVLVDTPNIGFGSQREICHKYWWTNLLYINNFYPNYGSLNDTCMGWTWYLANDMQFYIVLSPIVIILLFRWRKLGVVAALSLILTCIGLRVFFVLYYGLHGFQDGATRHKDDPYVQSGPMYQRPYTRMSVYLVGMLTGYIMASTKCRIKMNKAFVVVGWAVATATALAVIYGQYYYNHVGAKMTLTVSAFYVSLCRTAWAASLSWLVLACVSGYGGPVNSILSWQIWAPLGRLTYSAYLVHPIVIFVYYFNMQEPIHFTDLTLVYYFLANLVVSYGVAFVTSMTVEAPMMQLEKTIIKMKNE